MSEFALSHAEPGGRFVSVKLSKAAIALLLATRAHGTIWFSPWLNGVAEFVEYIEHGSEMA